MSVKSFFLSGLFVLASSVVAISSDEARCVQDFLNLAHFDVGKSDGELGRRSKSQAELLRFFNPEFELPELSSTTAAEWCSFAASDQARGLIEARKVIETVAMSDVKGATDLWRKYDDTLSCNGVRGSAKFEWLRSKDIKPFDAEVAAAMQPIFPSVEGSKTCAFGGTSQNIPGPAPVIEITSGDFYGDRDDSLTRINRAGEYLAAIIQGYSYERKEAPRASMVKFLLAWANANALSKGIRQPGDEGRALKFDFIEVLPLFIVAFSEVGPTMELDDRIKVGAWLRRLVGEVQYSAWTIRQDNKNYLRLYVSLLWGILTKDKGLTDISISEFKDAIYDMRPDGTFPRDSARGGSGLHYNARSTMMLFAFAHVARLVGVDLFAYEFEGRSIHTAINWTAVASMFPDLNTRHAATCVNGSNPDFTVENPDLAYLYPRPGSATIQSWAPLYAASSYAKPEVAERLLGVRRDAVGTVRESPLGGYFGCFASGIPDLVAAP